LRSPSFLQLLAKEFRELLASRAFWLLLLFVGLLVGHGFIKQRKRSAANEYVAHIGDLGSGHKSPGIARRQTLARPHARGPSVWESGSLVKDRQRELFRPVHCYEVNQ
jgi:hypothetical protein